MIRNPKKVFLANVMMRKSLRQVDMSGKSIVTGVIMP